MSSTRAIQTRWKMGNQSYCHICNGRTPTCDATSGTSSKPVLQFDISHGMNAITRLSAQQTKLWQHPLSKTAPVLPYPEGKPLHCASWTMFWGKTAIWLSIASWNLLSPWKGTSRVWMGSTFLFRSSAKTVWYMAAYGPPTTGMWREQVLPSYLSTSYWGCGCGR